MLLEAIACDDPPDGVAALAERRLDTAAVTATHVIGAQLSEFQAKVSWRKGQYMHVADCMSRNSINGAPEAADDSEGMRQPRHIQHIAMR